MKKLYSFFACLQRDDGKINRFVTVFVTDFDNYLIVLYVSVSGMTKFIISVALNFTGKSFDITYIRIVFYSPRPESFAIYKRQTTNGSWIPYQYYRYVHVFFPLLNLIMP